MISYLRHRYTWLRNPTCLDTWQYDLPAMMWYPKGWPGRRGFDIGTSHAW
jgi:hypothetical protein